MAIKPPASTSQLHIFPWSPPCFKKPYLHSLLQPLLLYKIQKDKKKIEHIHVFCDSEARFRKVIPLYIWCGQQRHIQKTKIHALITIARKLEFRVGTAGCLNAAPPTSPLLKSPLLTTSIRFRSFSLIVSVITWI